MSRSGIEEIHQTPFVTFYAPRVKKGASEMITTMIFTIVMFIFLFLYMMFNRIFMLLIPQIQNLAFFATISLSIALSIYLFFYLDRKFNEETDALLSECDKEEEQNPNQNFDDVEHSCIQKIKA